MKGWRTGSSGALWRSGSSQACATNVGRDGTTAAGHDAFFCPTNQLPCGWWLVTLHLCSFVLMLLVQHPRCPTVGLADLHSKTGVDQRSLQHNTKQQCGALESRLYGEAGGRGREHQAGRGYSGIKWRRVGFGGVGCVHGLPKAAGVQLAKSWGAKDRPAAGPVVGWLEGVRARR